MTQKALVLKHIGEFGSLLPAKNLGKPYGGGFFGAELSRVCRVMRKEGTLISKREGKFERFYLKDVIKLPPAFPTKFDKNKQDILSFET